MKVTRYLAVLPVLACAMFLLSCGDDDITDSWYTSITAPGTASGSLGISSDNALDDYAAYRITFPKAVAYSIVLSELKANGAIFLDTTGKNYTSIADLETNGSGVDRDQYTDTTNETYVFTPTAAGNSYFLVVDNKSTTEKNSFKLTITEALEGSVVK